MSSRNAYKGGERDLLRELASLLRQQDESLGEVLGNAHSLASAGGCNSAAGA